MAQDHNPAPSSLTRRALLGAAAGLMATGALGACASGKKRNGASAGNKLQITVTPFAGADLGTMPKEFVQEYMANHRNVEIRLDDSLLFAKQTAQWKADRDKPLCNLAFSNAGSTAAGKAIGMYQPLDYSQIPRTSGLAPELIDPEHVGVPLGADQLGLLYNTKGLNPPPTSWSRMWDVDMNGKLCFFTMPWEAIGMASLLNGGGWNNFDPGFRIWSERAKNIRTIVSANPQYLNVLSTGEAVLTSHYHGTSQVWKAGGAPLEFVSPQEGTILVPVGVNINAGSTDDQREVMYDMVNEMLSLRWMQRWADLSLEIPALPDVPLSERLRSYPAIARGFDQRFQQVDWKALGANTAEWTKRWEQDVVAKI